MNRAQAFLRAGKNKKALEDYASAIVLKDERQQQAYFDRGQLHMRLNDKKSALEDFKKVIELNPNNLQLTWDVGVLAYELELYTDALSYYSKTIDRMDQPQAQMLLVRGEVFEKLKNYQAAIQDYTRVIEMKQNLANAHYLRGQAKARLGKKEEACVDWKKAAELGNSEAKGVIVYNCE
jgi:tetratricopeptide (TPR) repeat protein